MLESTIVFCHIQNVKPKYDLNSLYRIYLEEPLSGEVAPLNGALIGKILTSN